MKKPIPVKLTDREVAAIILSIDNWLAIIGTHPNPNPRGREITKSFVELRKKFIKIEETLEP